MIFFTSQEHLFYDLLVPTSLTCVIVSLISVRNESKVSLSPVELIYSAQPPLSRIAKEY